MSAGIRGALLLAAGVLSACGSTKGEVPAVDGEQYYVGTSATDIWNAPPENQTMLRHWDGDAWSDVDLTSIGPSVAGPVAGPETIWVTTVAGFDWSLHRLGADGTTEAVDLPPPPDAPYDRSVRYQLFGWGDTLVADVDGASIEGAVRSRLYRRDGDAWTALPPLPDGLGVSGVRVGADGEIMAMIVDWTYTSACDDFNPNDAHLAHEDIAHGQASPYLWLRGDAWVRITGMRCVSQPEYLTDRFWIANPTFPIDDLWSTTWHFDGTRLRPLQVPGKVALYTHADGETVRFSERWIGAASRGGDAGGDDWSCDSYGNCGPVGASYTFRGTEWVASRWNGSAWAGEHVVAQGQACTGTGCAYVGTSPTIVGQLQDGTVMIYQPADGSVALVEP